MLNKLRLLIKRFWPFSLIVIVVIIAIPFLFSVGDLIGLASGKKDYWRRFRRSDPIVLPYEPAYSKHLSLLMSKKTDKYRYITDWAPTSWGRLTEEDAVLLKLYPFPIIQNYDPKNLIASKIDLLHSTPPETWQRFGIQGVGPVTSVDFDKKNFKVLLLGTEGSGLYRSTNFGVSWENLGLPSNRASAVLIDPKNSKHYYACSSQAGELFESFNGGSGWSKHDTGVIASTYGAAGLDFSTSKCQLALAADTLFY